MDLPTPENSNLLKMREKSTYFSDIKWALNDGRQMKSRDAAELKAKILSSARVLETIDQEALARLESKPGKVED